MFVCMGNICRSPVAHGIFDDLLSRSPLKSRIATESSGTGAWHLGDLPDSRMRRTAASHGVTLTHRSRLLTENDIEDYDLILAMDSDNYRAIMRLCRNPGQRDKVRMFRDFDPEGPGDVPDPYYGGNQGFEEVWRMADRSCRHLLNTLENDFPAD